jgi:HlyD family secretion protein
MSRNAKTHRRSVTYWLRRVLVISLAGAITAGLVLAWLPDPVPVDVTTVRRGPLQAVVEEDGRARVKDRYIVSAPLTGSLARIELEPGDSVKQGDVLARLVPLLPPLLDERTRSTTQAQLAAALAAQRQVSAQVERAEAAAKFAKADAERLAGLEQRGAIAPAELERAQLAARTAQAELESLRFATRVANHEAQMARASLQRLTGVRKTDPGAEDQLEVPSPITGRVLRIIQKSEGVAQAGSQLLELGDPSALEVAVDVLTADAVEIKPGAPATLERWGGEPLDARVRSIEPSAFTRVGALGVEEQRVNVLLEVTSPREKWAALGDGYRVEARIVIWRGEGVLSIPSSAAFRRGEQWSVFRVENGRAHETRVELGHRAGERVEVLAGLSEGASVVLHPSDRVTSGVKVEPRR